MKIQFRLNWAEYGVSAPRSFKSGPAQDLFEEYIRRISKFLPCEIAGGMEARSKSREPGRKVWICDRGSGSKMLSSEALADQIGKLLADGTKQLQIVIGGPDGFSKQALSEWNPDLKWCFGPPTFPHELAAVIASEQIYRALAILHRLPYHRGHSAGRK